MINDYVGKFIETYKMVVKNRNLEGNFDKGANIKEIADVAVNWIKGKLNLNDREYKTFLTEVKRRVNYSNYLSGFYLLKAAEKKLEDNRIEELNKILEYQGDGIFNLEKSCN